MLKRIPGEDINMLSNILFVADIETDNTDAFMQAVELAKNNQAKLSAICVIDTSYMNEGSAYYSVSLEAMITKRQELLESLAKGIHIAGSEVNVKVVTGREFVEIVREVLRHDYDLVVKCIEDNKSVAQRFFSGTDMKLLRKCPCPIWMVKSTKQQGDREILVAVDYQPDNSENDALNLRLLKLSASLALADFSELHIVHVWKLPFESYLRGPRTAYSNTEVDAMVDEEQAKRTQWLTELVESIDQAQSDEYANYLKPKLHVIQGEAKAEIPQLVKSLGAELVVMGTIARTGVPGLLIGNTAESILNQLECSVLALKPEGFKTPITL